MFGEQIFAQLRTGFRLDTIPTDMQSLRTTITSMSVQIKEEWWGFNFGGKSA